MRVFIILFCLLKLEVFCSPKKDCLVGKAIAENLSRDSKLFPDANLASTFNRFDYYHYYLEVDTHSIEMKNNGLKYSINQISDTTHYNVKNIVLRYSINPTVDTTHYNNILWINNVPILIDDSSIIYFCDTESKKSKRYFEYCRTSQNINSGIKGATFIDVFRLNKNVVEVIDRFVIQ